MTVVEQDYESGECGSEKREDTVGPKALKVMELAGKRKVTNAI